MDRDTQPAALIGAVQRPISANALLEASGPPAWRTIPSWSLVGTDDRVILLDMPAWCLSTGHTYLGFREARGEWRRLVARRSASS